MMYLPEPTVVDGICVCSELADCDHHACCGGCPDNRCSMPWLPNYGCGECWSRACYDHNIRDLVEILAEREAEGRPRSELEPIIKYIEDWREKYGKNQD